MKFIIWCYLVLSPFFGGVAHTEENGIQDYSMKGADKKASIQEFSKELSALFCGDKVVADNWGRNRALTITIPSRCKGKYSGGGLINVIQALSTKRKQLKVSKVANVAFKTKTGEYRTFPVVLVETSTGKLFQYQGGFTPIWKTYSFSTTRHSRNQTLS